MKRRSGKNARVFVYAGLENEQTYHVEAESASDPEGALCSLLQAASRWALDLRPPLATPPPPVSAFPSTPSRGSPGFSLLPQAAVQAEEARLFTKEEREYLSKQPTEARAELLSALKRVKLSEVFSVPMRLRVLQSAVPEDLKRRVLQKLEKHQESLSSGDGVKYFTWVEALLALPLARMTLPRTLPNSEELAHTLFKARQSLDAVVFGHPGAKQALLERLYLWIRHPHMPQRALALQGPPGNGKTTLVREGLAAISGRPFVFVALGGSFDSSSLLGHAFTYEGSMQGRVAEGLASAGCMNPIFFFDELDKCSATPKGEEVVNALVHLTDPAQNAHFRDRYFAGLDLDVSKALFVFSFNDRSKISPVLLDRFQIAQTDSFSAREQVKILQDYLLPRVLREHHRPPDFLTLSEAALREAMTAAQAGGVRAVRSALEQVVCKLSIYVETSDASLIFPLQPSDFGRLREGSSYVLLGGLFRLLEEAADGSSRPPCCMYS